MPGAVAITMNELTDDVFTQWSTMTPAQRVGIGHDTPARIRGDHGPKPLKPDPFRVSNDPHFEETLVDVVGLYLNPPDRALVDSLDEETPVPALDRTPR